MQVKDQEDQNNTVNTWIIGLFIAINMKMVISRCFGQKLSIILAVAVVLVSIVTQTTSQEPELPLVEDLEFDEKWGDEAYTVYFGEVRTSLGSNTKEYSLEDKSFPVEPHFIFPKQTPEGKKPTGWIKVKVKGDSGKYAFLLFTADTAYLYGFINENGMYCTQGSSGLFPIPGCVELPFKETYHGLFNQGDGVNINPFLGTVRLGRSAARTAASVLANYEHDPASTVESLESVRKAMLVFVLMTSEAVRFKPIREKCKSSWITGGFLSKEEYELVSRWKLLSILWCCEVDLKSEDAEWTQANARIKNQLGIESLAQIDAILDMVKNENRCEDKRKEIKSFIEIIKEK